MIAPLRNSGPYSDVDRLEGFCFTYSNSYYNTRDDMVENWIHRSRTEWYGVPSMSQLDMLDTLELSEYLCLIAKVVHSKEMVCGGAKNESIALDVALEDL